MLPRLLTADACGSVIARLGEFDGSAGSRDLLEREWCHLLSQELRDHSDVAGLLPAGHDVVQCNFFDKSAEKNWLVGLHQDLSVPVAERVDTPGLSGWCVKQGQTFVQAPRELLQDLLVLRLHLEDCGPDDGPLRVVPASHRQGVLEPEAARALRDRSGETICCVGGGGVLAMRPLLLHASSKSTGLGRRRVLHFVYGPAEPGWGLQWPQLTSMRC